MEKIIINIDSKFRDNNIYSSSAKFTLRLADTIKNVTSIKISSIEFSNNLSSHLANYNYVFIKINDYGNLYTIFYNDKNYLYPYKILGKIILSLDNTSSLYNNSNFVTKEYIFKQPINISKFDIELLDPNGNFINMLSDEYSFTLELLHNIDI